MVLIESVARHIAQMLGEAWDVDARVARPPAAKDGHPTQCDRRGMEGDAKCVAGLARGVIGAFASVGEKVAALCVKVAEQVAALALIEHRPVGACF